MVWLCECGNLTKGDMCMKCGQMKPYKIGTEDPGSYNRTVGYPRTQAAAVLFGLFFVGMLICILVAVLIPMFAK